MLNFRICVCASFCLNSIQFLCNFHSVNLIYSKLPVLAIVCTFRIVVVVVACQLLFVIVAVTVFVFICGCAV